MSILYCNSFKCSDGELKNFPELSNSNSSRRQHVHGYTGGGDYRYVGATNLEVESVFPRFMPSCNRPDDSGSQSVGVIGEGFVKLETTESEFCDGSSSLYRNQEVRFLQGHNSVVAGVGTAIDSSFSSMNSEEIENSQLSSRKFSNLLRQTSCPTEFSNFPAVENGFGKTTNSRSFGSYNGTNLLNPSDQWNFSNDLPLFSKRMREISEGNMVSDGLDAQDFRNGSDQPHVTSFLNNSWDDSVFRSLKRARDNNGTAFSPSNSLDYKFNTEYPSSIPGLTHHLSLPKTFSEVATKEKLFQFRDAVPCKIRAKRGCATHPRSIAERVRRTRISERMKKLQDLFPDMDKQTSIADMLDWAVEHIKNLQRQVQNLSDSSAKCSCST